MKNDFLPITKEDIDAKLNEMAAKNARVISGDENSVLENGDTVVIEPIGDKNYHRSESRKKASTF